MKKVEQSATIVIGGIVTLLLQQSFGLADKVMQRRDENAKAELKRKWDLEDRRMEATDSMLLQQMLATHTEGVDRQLANMAKTLTAAGR